MLNFRRCTTSQAPYAFDARRVLHQRKAGEKKEKKRFCFASLQFGLVSEVDVALTLVFAPISYGAIQVRISEMLTILPMFTPAAIPGLFLGCLIANLVGGAIIWDIIFGSIATLIGAVFGYLLRKNRWLVPIPAIIANAVIIQLVLRYGYRINIPLLLLVLYIAIGEIAGCYVLGEILGAVLSRYGKHIFRNQ